MAVLKRIVCLANSRKLNGRCVAGIELFGSQRIGWIRPVSAREHEEVSEYERQYENGSDPRVLDIIDVPLVEARPSDYQRENWLLDPNRYWVKVGRAGWDEAAALVDPVATLWLDGFSTGSGQNDRIPLAQALGLTSSLRLIRVTGFVLAVFKPGEPFGNPKRRVQARFRHCGTEYRIWVTDPVYERDYLMKADGQHEIGESLLVVSVGEPFNGACYKLVAAIIEREKS